MNTVFIFHGSNGYPEENWFPWLRSTLRSFGREVIVPQFPISAAQTLRHWQEVFAKYHDKMNNETILVGHSLGGSFLLRVLERIDTPIHASFLVSVPIGIPPIQDHEADTTFTGHPFRWVKIRSVCQQFFVFHAEDDGVVCYENGMTLAHNLGTNLTIVPAGGHCNTASGYVRFDLLLEKILSVL